MVETGQKPFLALCLVDYKTLREETVGVVFG
jgi:hypothetical protein